MKTCIAALLSSLFIVVACAEGTTPRELGPDAFEAPDANLGGTPDANTGGPPDAFVSIPDANTGGPPDANTGGLPDAGGLPGTCTDNSQCTVAGECCFTLLGLCVQGTEDPIFGCLPA